MTPSERLLAKMCEETFLGFWSYANTFREQGGPKELCDLLVLFGDHVILFSDKSCEFPNSGELDRDWARWYRRAIHESAKQAFGAERWIKKHPERIYLDNKCQHKLPIAFPAADKCRFHRVAVALGAGERCISEHGGSGNLHLTPSIVGDAHFASHKFDLTPFHVGMVVGDGNFVHVFDHLTLPLVLKELDTISDFTGYLEFKEALSRSGKVGTIAGEENLLALYLSKFIHTDNWEELLKEATDGAVVAVGEGAWQLFQDSEPYLAQKEACRPSYVWDRIIKDFAEHAFAGTLVPGSAPTVSDNESIFRCMAKETRLSRGFLVSTMAQRWRQHTERNCVDFRIVQSPSDADTLYAFVFVPNNGDTESEYRDNRQFYLQSYCFLVADKKRTHRRVIGIATQAGDEPYRTFDVFLLERVGEEYAPANVIRELEQELEVTGDGTIHFFDHDEAALPQLPKVNKQRSRRSDRGRPVRIGRNEPCPCGSGKKYKKCCH